MTQSPESPSQPLNGPETDNDNADGIEEQLRQVLKDEGVADTWEPADRLAPDDVFDRYVDRHTGDLNDKETQRPGTLDPKRKAWELFCQWFQTESDADSLADLGDYFAETYAEWVRDTTEKKNVTMGKHLRYVKSVIEWCQPRYVHPDVPYEWDIPDNNKQRDEILDPDDGETIEMWVNDNQPYTRAHAVWVLVWRVGLRAGAIRSIDLDAVELYPEEEDIAPFIRLEDRPWLGPDDDRGLNLKGAKNAEAGYRDRLAPIDEYTRDVLEGYIRYERRRHDSYKYPEAGPGLITTSHSDRVSIDTIEADINWLTTPAGARDEPCDCEYCQENGPITHRTKARRCKHARAPHPVRHGAITHMANSLMLWDEISMKTGTSVAVLKENYDRGTDKDKLRRITRRSHRN